MQTGCLSEDQIDFHTKKWHRIKHYDQKWRITNFSSLCQIDLMICGWDWVWITNKTPTNLQWLNTLVPSTHKEMLSELDHLFIKQVLVYT